METALVMLDVEGRIWGVSPSAEAKLGWRGATLDGRDWVDTLSEPDDRDAEARMLSLALSGQRRRVTLKIRTQEGDRRSIDLDVTLVGRGSAEIAAGVVGSVRDLETPTPSWSDGDFDYRVSRAPFGEVRAAQHLQAGNRVLPAEQLRCYEAFHGRSAPCDNCPVLASAEGESKTETRTIREREPLIEIMTARPSSRHAGETDVSVRRIPIEVRGALVEARIRDLAAAAKLTEREREVLRYLVMGRAVQDIATILGVRPRTVKFHQANIVEKLGADSRADLFRLIL